MTTKKKHGDINRRIPPSLQRRATISETTDSIKTLPPSQSQSNNNIESLQTQVGAQMSRNLHDKNYTLM